MGVVSRPKVSIIVPVYNVEKYVRSCFDSLLKQSLKDIEIILVDDGSTDTSSSICDEYALKDKRVKVIHQENQGASYSRNSGIKVSTGEYIGFVDSDDMVSENMFDTLYNNAVKYGAEVSCCSWRKFVEEEDIDKSQQENMLENIKLWEGKDTVLQYMLQRIGMPPESERDNLYGAAIWYSIFSKDIIDEYSIEFTAERRFIIAEDMLFNIDVITKCQRIVHSDKVLYYYRYTPGSITTSYKPDRFEINLDIYQEMYRKLKDYYTREQCFDSMSRYFITFTRIAMIQEVRYVSQKGIKNVYKRIREICGNKELQSIFREYNYLKLPFKYRIICILQHKKMSLLLTFLMLIAYR